MLVGGLCLDKKIHLARLLIICSNKIIRGLGYKEPWASQQYTYLIHGLFVGGRLAKAKSILLNSKQVNFCSKFMRL